MRERGKNEVKQLVKWWTRKGERGALSPPQTPDQLAFLANFFCLFAPLQSLVPGSKIVSAGSVKDETGFYDE